MQTNYLGIRKSESGQAINLVGEIKYWSKAAAIALGALVAGNTFIRGCTDQNRLHYSKDWFGDGATVSLSSSALQDSWFEGDITARIGKGMDRRKFPMNGVARDLFKTWFDEQEAYGRRHFGQEGIAADQYRVLITLIQAARPTAVAQVVPAVLVTNAQNPTVQNPNEITVDDMIRAYTLNITFKGISDEQRKNGKCNLDSMCAKVKTGAALGQ